MKVFIRPGVRPGSGIKRASTEVPGCPARQGTGCLDDWAGGVSGVTGPLSSCPEPGTHSHPWAEAQGSRKPRIATERLPSYKPTASIGGCQWMTSLAVCLPIAGCRCRYWQLLLLLPTATSSAVRLTVSSRPQLEEMRSCCPAYLLAVAGPIAGWNVGGNKRDIQDMFSGLARHRNRLPSRLLKFIADRPSSSS